MVEMIRNNITVTIVKVTQVRVFMLNIRVIFSIMYNFMCDHASIIKTWFNNTFLIHFLYYYYLFGVLRRFIYLFGVLRRFQHCTGHIMTGSWKGKGNQYIEFARVLYCKLPTNGKQLPAFPHKALTGIEPRPQRWEARVLPLCHRGPFISFKS